MQQVSRVTVLMSRACLYSFFDELYGEALNAPLCPSPSRQSDHDLTFTEVARWYRSSLEHVTVAGRNDRSIIERHTRREIVRRLEPTATPATKHIHTCGTHLLHPISSSQQVEFPIRHFFFFPRKTKILSSCWRKSCRMNNSSKIIT